MKTLYLLRHAKSAWDDPSLHDHDRPLAPRGKKAAPLIGRHLRDRKARVDLALCSTARRARQTCDRVLAEMGDGKPPVELERRLYLCGASALLERLHAVPDSVAALMLVAHNPDLHELALRLIGGGNQAMRASLAEKFPTAAYTILTFDTARWSDLAEGSGMLVDFVRPRDLTFAGPASRDPA